MFSLNYPAFYSLCFSNTRLSSAHDNFNSLLLMLWVITGVVSALTALLCQISFLLPKDWCPFDRKKALLYESFAVQLYKGSLIKYCRHLLYRMFMGYVSELKKGGVCTSWIFILHCSVSRQTHLIDLFSATPSIFIF